MKGLLMQGSSNRDRAPRIMKGEIQMMQENTKRLIDSINAGEHSQEATDFVKVCVDHVEATRGPSEDVAAVRDALRQHA